MADTFTFRGYTEAELSEAFKLVAPKDDWRGPIDAWVPAKAWVRIETAIKFYTATDATAINAINGKVRLKAAGYRAGPAGP